LFDCLEGNQKIYLVCNSKQNLNEIIFQIRSRYPGKKLIHYDSDNANEKDIKESLMNVNKSWIEYDMVATTPTITCGIDFNVPNYFDKNFVIATPKSCCVRDVKQMMGRVRHLKQNEICFFIKPQIANRATDIEEIRELIMRRINHEIDVSEKYFPTDDIEGGEDEKKKKEDKKLLDKRKRVESYIANISALNEIEDPNIIKTVSNKEKSDWLLEVHLINTQEKNLSFNDFSDIFKLMLTNQKIKIVFFDEIENQTKIIKEMKVEIKVNKNEYKECQGIEYNEAPNLQEGEAKEYKKKQEQRTITAKEKVALQKYNIQKYFSIPLPYDDYKLVEGQLSKLFHAKYEELLSPEDLCKHEQKMLRERNPYSEVTFGQLEAIKELMKFINYNQLPSYKVTEMTTLPFKVQKEKGNEVLRKCRDAFAMHNIKEINGFTTLQILKNVFMMWLGAKVTSSDDKKQKQINKVRYDYVEVKVEQQRIISDFFPHFNCETHIQRIKGILPPEENENDIAIEEEYFSGFTDTKGQQIKEYLQSIGAT